MPEWVNGLFSLAWLHASRAVSSLLVACLWREEVIEQAAELAYIVL